MKEKGWKGKCVSEREREDNEEKEKKEQKIKNKKEEIYSGIRV